MSNPSLMPSDSVRGLGYKTTHVLNIIPGAITGAGISSYVFFTVNEPGPALPSNTEYFLAATGFGLGTLVFLGAKNRKARQRAAIGFAAGIAAGATPGIVYAVSDFFKNLTFI